MPLRVGERSYARAFGESREVSRSHSDSESKTAPAADGADERRDPFRGADSANSSSAEYRRDASILRRRRFRSVACGNPTSVRMIEAKRSPAWHEPRTRHLAQHFSACGARRRLSLALHQEPKMRSPGTSKRLGFPSHFNHQRSIPTASPQQSRPGIFQSALFP